MGAPSKIRLGGRSCHQILRTKKRAIRPASHAHMHPHWISAYARRQRPRRYPAIIIIAVSANTRSIVICSCSIGHRIHAHGCAQICNSPNIPRPPKAPRRNVRDPRKTYTDKREKTAGPFSLLSNSSSVRIARQTRIRLFTFVFRRKSFASSLRAHSTVLRRCLQFSAASLLAEM